MKKLIVLLGPTASGKTAWAVDFAKKFNGEIVSADSRQIYKKMDIGTAKPNGFKHYMVDIAPPDRTFTLAEYKDAAIKIINDICERGLIPFLVGGTGLYITALVDNWEIPRVSPSLELRSELEKKSLGELEKQLREIDPDAFEFVDVKNKRRIIRAIEATILGGSPFSCQRMKGKPLFDILQIGIEIQREELHRRVDARVDEMIKSGLEDEVRNLANEYGWDAPGMSSIGYRQFRSYFEGKIDLSEAMRVLKRDTRSYAKRQMTWFRKDSRIHWMKNEDEAEKLIEKFLRP